MTKAVCIGCIDNGVTLLAIDGVLWQLRCRKVARRESRVFGIFCKALSGLFYRGSNPL